MSRKSVSIIISAFNEEENIEQLYDRLSIHLSKAEIHGYEIIFVNDGSTDATLDRCKKILQRDPKVKIVNLSRNFGHEVAMTAGMDYAKGDCAIFMDADFQHPPELIPELIRYWQEGYDIVWTKRIYDKRQPLLKRLSTTFFYKVLNYFSDVSIPANNPDFRLLDKKYIKMLKKMKEGNRMFRGMVNLIGTANAATVEFVAPNRLYGKSKYNLRESLRLSTDSIVQFSIKPLRFATYIGFTAAFLSLLLGAYTIWEHFARNTPKTGYATIVTAIIFIGAVQLIAIGIIGEYIGRVHLEVKGRPLYFADYITHENFEEYDNNNQKQ